MRSLLPAPAWVHEFVEASLSAVERSVRPPGAQCPRCEQPLDLAGYRKTQTSYLTQEVLACTHCGAQLLLSRVEQA